MEKLMTGYIRQIILEENKFEFFVLLSMLYLLPAVIINEYVITDELYYRSLGDQLNINMIDNLINFQNKWQWVGYATIPLILAIKFLLVGTFLSMGSIVAGHNLSFMQIFAMAMVAEVVYLAANFITSGNILFSEINHLEDLNVSLLSLASLFTESSTAPYLYAPMKSISLFLLIYILILTWCYRIITGYPFDQSLILVLATYGTSFVMWIILIMYLMLSYA